MPAKIADPLRSSAGAGWSRTPACRRQRRPGLAPVDVDDLAIFGPLFDDPSPSRRGDVGETLLPCHLDVRLARVGVFAFASALACLTMNHLTGEAHPGPARRTRRRGACWIDVSA